MVESGPELVEIIGVLLLKMVVMGIIYKYGDLLGKKERHISTIMSFILLGIAVTPENWAN